MKIYFSGYDNPDDEGPNDDRNSLPMEYVDLKYSPLDVKKRSK
jgi:hypothetical protein